MSELDETKKFIEEYTSKIEPLFKSAHLAWWDAYAKGKEEGYKKYEEILRELKKIHHNKEEFKKITDWLKKEIKDPLIKRQLQIMYKEYLVSQGDLGLINEIIAKETAIEKKFNKFRAKLGDRELKDNEIKEILKKEINSEKRKKVWEASKKQGEIVESELLEIIKLRNKLARSLGFKNYYIMALEAQEQSLEYIREIFENLSEKTEKVFKDMKRKIDSRLSKEFMISIEELKPWHYHDLFFQEMPEIFELDLDEFFKKDILSISKRFYTNIGLDTGDILERSDLYERKGKSQHGFALDMDRKGDIRILENIKDNEYWLSTTLHELGHGLYWKYINSKLPFLLREVAHTFTTEAIARLFERQTKNLEFIKKYAEKNSENISRELDEMSRASILVFIRWAQVMVNFEMKLYDNPNQDLNKLWWDLVKKYQFINFHRDKPDWCSKIHFSIDVAYYHNYVLGDLLASQLHNIITKKILKKDSLKNIDYSESKEIGKYLKKKVFEPGMLYKWDEFIEKATGEKLTPKYFIEEFVRE